MIEILHGDCLDVLPTLEAGSVQCCITSPPYWGLRDYGTATWEGGDAECDHKQFLGGNGLASAKQMTSNGTQEYYYRDNCPKCGARRIDSQLGLESTPEEYVAKMVKVFREVWRVLKDDGTLWLNIGDCYVGANNTNAGNNHNLGSTTLRMGAPDRNSPKALWRGLRAKNLVGIPWLVAFALQADGWYLRSDIIWHKPNPMPESVTDRPTKSHEYIFLLTKNGGNPLIWRARDTGEWSYNPDLSEMMDKNGTITRRHESWKGSRFDVGKTAIHQLNRSQDRSDLYDLDHEDRIDQEDAPIDLGEVPRWKGFDYYYDADAIREPVSMTDGAIGRRLSFDPSKQIKEAAMKANGTKGGNDGARDPNATHRNRRSVWSVATQPYGEAHFATFPEDLIKPCIMAGSRVGNTVLDPFAGSGTTGKVAIELGRKSVLIELNPKYIEMIKKRVDVTPGML